MKLLVTGGAGYIGSHVTRLAQHSGHEVEVIDDLSTGLSMRVDAPLHQLQLATDAGLEDLHELLGKGNFDAVIHLAARKQVGESVFEPETYFKDNIAGLANLLIAMRASSTRKLVFSSSAATYGMPDVEKVSEQTECHPINPYGETKLIGEWLVRNAKTWGLQGVNLRYFNVAGTGYPDLADKAALNLIPIAIGQLMKNQEPVVFGNDYPTEDGSCVRDYVHVSDLARAHLAAIDYLAKPDRSFDTFNVGTGTGASVFEVLSELRKASGVDFELKQEGRRAGDPPRLVADVSRIQAELGFECELGLAEIVDSAWKSAQI
jgi:UDP-glucose 4-epimerase